MSRAWQFESIGRVCAVIDCKHVTAPFGSQGYPVASIGEIGERFIDLTRAPRTTAQFHTLLTQGGRKPAPGDLIMTRNATVGRVSRVSETHPSFAMGQDVCLLRPNSTMAVPEFVQIALGSSSVSRQIEATMAGSTFKRLNVQQIKQLRIPVPSRDEQMRIAAVVNDAEDSIATLERLIAKKQAIKQGMMQQVFTVPEVAAQPAALGTLVSMLSGGTPDRGNGAYWSGDIPWISATTLKRLEVCSSDQCVTEAAVRAHSKMAPLNSTLILVRGSALHSEIRASLVVAPVCFNQDVKAMVPSPKTEPKFLTYSIHANATRLLRLVTSAGNTAGVLDTKILKNFEIWLPDLEIQRRVIATFDDVSGELDTLSARLSKARAIKTGMMQQLLTGRTRLPVDAEP